MKPAILVVDDDVAVCELLQDVLSEHVFTVLTCHTGQDAVNRVQQDPGIALVLLDMMLPDINGLQVLLQLQKQRPDLPVVMLTGLGSESDVVVGLEMGADDYLPKPFNPRELLARIRAVLRRHTVELPGAPSAAEKMVSFGAYQLNLATRELSRDGEPVALTSGEFAVLKVLVSHPREPLSRDKLMNLARGREYTATERSIDVQVSRLRRLLEQDPAQPRYLQTVWGLGYVFVPAGENA